jgi:hypothetical protein
MSILEFFPPLKKDSRLCPHFNFWTAWPIFTNLGYVPVLRAIRGQETSVVRKCVLNVNQRFKSKLCCLSVSTFSPGEFELQLLKYLIFEVCNCCNGTVTITYGCIIQAVSINVSRQMRRRVSSDWKSLISDSLTVWSIVPIHWESVTGNRL